MNSTIGRVMLRNFAHAGNPLGKPTPVAFASILPSQLHGEGRSLSTATTSWYEQKKVNKEMRRERFEKKQERVRHKQTRRAGKPRDGKRTAFRSWFLKRKIDEEYMDRKARQANLDWKIQVSVILERPNIVVDDQPEWEKEFEKVQLQMGQYDWDYPEQFTKNRASSEEFLEDNEELIQYLTNVKGFTPAPRETEADAKGDVRTTNRKLKTRIYLAIQEDSDWAFPTVDLKEDETFLQAARRAIPEKVGQNVEFWCPSHCPCAVDMKAFPSEQHKDGYYGIKTFFMKLQLDEGEVDKSSTVKDFAWLDRGEMVDRIQGQSGDDKFFHYLL